MSSRLWCPVGDPGGAEELELGGDWPEAPLKRRRKGDPEKDNRLNGLPLC